VVAALSGVRGDRSVIDAADISLRTIGRNLPNTPLLAAVVRLTGIMDKETFFENMEKAFGAKFAHKNEMIEGNMRAVREAWASVLQINEK
jgi:pyruvate ferredoxin oxidoreductase gamma subunit